jgi:putative flippase GtrA
MIKNKAEKLRFGIVGAVNTVIDFGVLFLLTAGEAAPVAANIASTSLAFTFSFFANKHYTFKARGTANLRREIILFILVTLTGLWVLQSIVIYLFLLAAGSQQPGSFTLFAAKALATVVSLTWNYLLYSRVVFKTQP